MKAETELLLMLARDRKTTLHPLFDHDHALELIEVIERANGMPSEFVRRNGYVGDRFDQAARGVREAWQERCLSAHGAAYTLTRPDWMDAEIAAALRKESQETARKIRRTVAEGQIFDSIGPLYASGYNTCIVNCVAWLTEEFGLEPEGGKHE